MIGKFDAVFSAARTNVALLSWCTRFLKRNRFSVRRITHKGRKLHDNVQVHYISRSINFAVEEDGIFPPSYSEQERYGNLFNMDQTGLGIDNPGRITIDFKGAKTVDVVQGMRENGSRCRVFLCASSTGMKLPAFTVFAEVPGGPVYQEVSSPILVSSTRRKQKRFTTMQRCKNGLTRFIWTPSTQGCRMLMLNSLKVHKMDSLKTRLEECCTDVQYIPPGITGLSQPMDVSVMHSFKSIVQYLYRRWHIDNPFVSNASERRLLLSKMIGEA
ncbi:hypothetical protein PHMEG_00023138 [Phytophthora megakarya]|uniref:DDE-1 domain-containing protein n=1 Tax=Phytophthora megakarya TaxID=4795 RepID=A0A225VHK4_9STRA|nr:hypothetical protein PHMEG_00023138 [Phytophthora megakarya]